MGKQPGKCERGMRFVSGALGAPSTSRAEAALAANDTQCPRVRFDQSFSQPKSASATVVRTACCAAKQFSRLTTPRAPGGSLIHPLLARFQRQRVAPYANERTTSPAVLRIGKDVSGTNPRSPNRAYRHNCFGRTASSADHLFAPGEGHRQKCFGQASAWRSRPHSKTISPIVNQDSWAFVTRMRKLVVPAGKLPSAVPALKSATLLQVFPSAEASKTPLSR